jgi:hypothetical protein
LRASTFQSRNPLSQQYILITKFLQFLHHADLNGVPMNLSGRSILAIVGRKAGIHLSDFLRNVTALDT